jgi:multidrug efflux pump subunit AcrA (membrane-fusion protein)
MLAAPDSKKVAIAKLNLEAAQQSVKLAEKSLAQAKKQLGDATITAPFDGMVATINAEVGDFVTTPSLLAPSVIIHLIDTKSMEIYQWSLSSPDRIQLGWQNYVSTMTERRIEIRYWPDTPYNYNDSLSFQFKFKG